MMSTRLKRSFDAEFINSVLNDASVKEGAEIKGILDATDIVQNLNNFLLVNDHGGFIYRQIAQGTYEVHTQFLEKGRGIKAFHAATESVRWMFLKTDCMRIISKARPENIGACQLAERVLRQKGFNGTYNYYSLEYMEWVENDRVVSNRGMAFHHFLDDNINHDEDTTHDAHVGAAILMCENAMPRKAVEVYNYWALASGYEMAAIHTMNPLIISVGDLRLAFPLEVI